MKKLNLAVIFGGRSGEHEIALLSAKNIIAALDRDKYNLTLIGIDKEGNWHYEPDENNFLINFQSADTISLKKTNIDIAFLPCPRKENLVIFVKEGIVKKEIDVILPVLHGPYGEDGTLQGYFELTNIPYAGADVLGSAVGMDKDVMKRLIRDAGIPCPKFLVFNAKEYKENKISYEKITKELGSPFFIKPANLGSSIGISKVKDKSSFDKAIKDAFLYDQKILVEEAITGREIECAVLGNEDPKASIPGEIIPNHEFYSYEAKYLDENGAKLEFPAKLTEKEVKEVREMAIKIYKALCTSGLARVDFFMTQNKKFLCNEINTFPGFTKISMFPKLWEITGVPYKELLDKLIELAIEKKKKKNELKISR